MRSQQAYVAGELFAFPLQDERWGGLQIAYVDEAAGPELVALDYIGETRPTREELAESKPLWLSHHTHGGTFCRVRVGQRPHPWDFVALGTAPLVTSFEERSNAWADWTYARYQRLAQWRWDHEISPGAREIYKELDIGRDHIEVRASGGRRLIDRATRQLTLLPRNARADASWQVPLPAGARFDWDELAGLTAVTELTYVGRDESVLELAASLPLLDRFIWHGHGKREIDMSAVQAHDIVVDAGLTLAIKLPPDVDTLTVQASKRTRWVAIDDPYEGRRLELLLRDPLPATIAGPAELRRLRASSLLRAPCERFARCRALRELELSGAPGQLVAPSALAALPELRQLALSDFYAIDGDVSPRADWPMLDTLTFDGLRASDAEMLHQRMRGLRRLELSSVLPLQR